MKTSKWRLLVIFGYLTAAAMELSAADTAERESLFTKTVAPALAAKCVGCHRPDNLKGGLDLSTQETLLKGGDSGAALVLKDAATSMMYTRAISNGGQVPEMPAKGEPLTHEESDALREWIDAGADWPAQFVLREKARTDGRFWSFQPIGQVDPPVVSDGSTAWSRNPIDRFLIAKLNEMGLQPNPPAKPQSLIRRATFDLTGLPPTPDEVADFVQAVTTQGEDSAIEQLVNRLLESPRYGEAWGRHWLDVIRFGESRGYERNEIITNLWPFRDYVIRSVNDDKPFDQFIREHLAGDVIGKNQPDIEIGSAFLVSGPYDDVGNSDPIAAAQIRADQIDEMIRATSEAFLGLSIGCARCHDHKFDPVLTKDYYSLYATFSGTSHGARDVATSKKRNERSLRLKPLQDEHARLSELLKSEDDATKKADLERTLAELKQQIDQIPGLPVWWVGRHAESPGPFNVFIGGSPQRLGEEVAPASLRVLDRLASSYQLNLSIGEGERRLALGKWLTSKDHPLVPRVLANRVWHYHFGTGIVNTPSDFGDLGGRPTHPELLDWLAQQLLQNDWRLKPLHRLIMTSQAYRQSSEWREDQAAKDSESRMLWRYPSRRLNAEEVRDMLLFVTGNLNLTMGGIGFRLYEYQQDNVATYIPLDEHGPETFRRAVYHHSARASRVDVLTDFDCPDPAFAEPRRASTTTPLQALTLMNHRFSLKMSQALADRIEREEFATADRVVRAFSLALSRQPSSEELLAGVDLINSHGLRAFCRALLNTNELLYVD